MDQSDGKAEPEGEEVAVVEIAGTAAPRRSGRCVQKKLNFYGGGGPDGPGKEQEEDEEEGENEESDGERKGKRKRKGKERAPPKKVLSSQKDSLEASRKACDFFVKISEKRSQKKLEITSSMVNGFNKASPIGKKSHCQPQGEVKDSMKCNTTPKHSRSPYARQKLLNADSVTTKSPVTKVMDKNQPILDLWFQAKVDAEENQRLSAGRQIHPFFSSWKASKKVAESLETDKLLNSSYLNSDKCCPPIHVFDTQEETINALNWGNWNLNHESFLSHNVYGAPDCLSTAVFDGSIEPLKLENDTNSSNLEMNGESPKYLTLIGTKRKKESISSFLTGSSKTQQQLPYSEEIHESGIIHQSILCSPQSSLVNMQDEGLNEMSNSYHIHYASHSDHNLWTRKYQPEKVTQVCGNADAVKTINEWLQSWHERNLKKNKTNIMESTCITIDSDCSSSSQSYSDTDSEDVENQLGNVLLVSGPVGCGKSAAVYACAKEQGFEVIEVNASDQRNGAFVKQKFGEATESHGLNICSGNDQNDAESRHDLTLKVGREDNIATPSHVPEVSSWTCKQDFMVHDLQTNTTDGKATICQVTNRSLLLFEDVDTVFDEDRGFLGTIMQLAETSKRPIILTTNSKDPGLPKLLLKQAVDFIPPSHEELFSLMSMICAVEQICISSLLLKRLITACQGDIRKAISYLQFWCQGEKGRNIQTSNDPVHFDLEAAHLVMPQIIPWGFPCKLSEIISEEITRTYLTLKENFFEEDLVKQKDYGSMKDIFSSSAMFDNKNKAGSRSFSMTNFKEVLSPLNDDKTSDFSCSPVKFVRKSRSCKSVSVLSSDSGEEHLEDFQKEGNGSELFSLNQSPEASLVPVSFSTDFHADLLVNDSKSQELVPCSLSLFGTQTCATTWENNISVNISCIPESEFFTGSELDCRIEHSASADATISPPGRMNPCNVIGGVGIASKFSLHAPIKVEASCLYTESVHGTEDLQDMEVGRVKCLDIGDQFVDECSRVDFNIVTVPDEKESLIFDGGVQETWMRLRNSRHKLGSYLTNDHKAACQTLKLATGMTSLLSHTDTMLSGCTSVTCDIIQPDMVPCTEPLCMAWYDQLWEMASTLGEHGLCHYVKYSASLNSEVPCKKSLNLSHEILGYSSNIMALGKLLLKRSSCCDLYPDRSIDFEKLNNSWSEREGQLKLCNSILPAISLRSCMALKGHAFHEYMTCLSHISKLENSRLAQRMDGEKRQRRARASQHYLQSYPLTMSHEDVMLLAQQCCFENGGFG